MKISQLLDSPSVRILTHLHEKGQVRHSELEEFIQSRGTLATNLNDLLNEGLVARKVITSRPIQSIYSLTEKGKDVGKLLVQLESLLK